ncbi:hypothetical protein BJ944DRAFT_268526 [Cunninghamella echinulata]|nr:hypothetical protein BJ944DRAFT_268526 [Cunninghamella echinulata]
MTSFRVKLYEIMDDLWDKARLLHACSRSRNSPIIPSYASQYNYQDLFLLEKHLIDNTNFHLEYAKSIYLQLYDEYKNKLYNLKNLDLTKMTEDEAKKHKDATMVLEKKCEDTKIRCMEINSLEENALKESPCYTNLIDIQMNPQLYCLSVTAANHLISNAKPMFNEEILSTYLLNNDDSLRVVYIPFFILKNDGINGPPPPTFASGIYLFGSFNQNRWIIFPIYSYLHTFDNYLYWANIHYIFNIY